MNQLFLLNETEIYSMVAWNIFESTPQYVQNIIVVTQGLRNLYEVVIKLKIHSKKKS